MSTVEKSVNDVRAHRARLAAEIKSVEAKAQRLREALAHRKINLSKLDAQLALAGENARGPSNDA